MSFLPYPLDYVIPFLIVLSIVVFVHELGHYLVARWNGVKVEAFSIGFGGEVFGFTDRAGTRWKFAWLPLGGYVRMLGDADATSTTHDAQTARDPNSFPAKRVGQRMAVIAAGPLANFVFAVLVLAALFAFAGRPFTPPVAQAINEGSPAAAAGLMAEDRFVEVEGRTIDSFEDVQQVVRLAPGEALDVIVLRDGREIDLTVTPEAQETTDRFGNTHRIGLIGVQGPSVEFAHSDPATAVFEAVGETGRIIGLTLAAVGEIIVGSRGTEELGGPLRIAQMSGQVAQDGAVSVLWFMALISINLGLINLFPIPMLDGGHLAMYSVEAVRGRPLTERTQEYAFRIGLALVLTLMVFATWNDLVHLEVFSIFAGDGS